MHTMTVAALLSDNGIIFTAELKISIWKLLLLLTYLARILNDFLSTFFSVFFVLKRSSKIVTILFGQQFTGSRSVHMAVDILCRKFLENHTLKH